MITLLDNPAIRPIIEQCAHDCARLVDAFLSVEVDMLIADTQEEPPIL